MFNMQQGVRPSYMWVGNGLVRPHMWINSEGQPQPQPQIWINNEGQQQLWTSAEAPPQLWASQEVQPQMWAPQEAQPQIWSHQEAQPPVLWVPQEGQQQLSTNNESQTQIWAPPDAHQHLPINNAGPIHLWTPQNAQQQPSTINNESQTQMWINNNELVRPPSFVTNEESQSQMLASNETRSQMLANNNARVPPFVNNEGEATPWVNNNSEENPQMWVNNGVEQPIRNVIVGPPANCIKYLTCTEINMDAPQEAIGSSVSDYLMFLFESGNYHDTLFNLVDLEVTVPAHSFLLVGKSLLFRKIFVDCKTQPCKISVDGASHENFRLFLKCFYSDSVDFSPAASLDILRLAIKFEVKSLIARCSGSVRANISVTSVLSIFSIASEWDQPDLKHWSLEFISQNASQVLKDSNFEKLSMDKILSIVNHDNLVVPEVEIFEAILRWADFDLRRRKIPVSTTARRKLIGPIMPYIRFLLMTSQELWDIVRPVQVLNSAEFMEIFSYVSEKEKGIRNLTIPAAYETTPRGSKYIAIMYDGPCTREPSSYLSSTAEKHVFIEEFRFKSDFKMYLCGICLYGSGLHDQVKKHRLYVDYDITFRIMGENRQQNLFSTNEFKKTANLDFEVLLPSNYPIVKDCLYTAILEVSGYRARFGMKRVNLKEMKLSGGRFAIVKFFERKDVSVFSHVGICRGLIFTLNSN